MDTKQLTSDWKFKTQDGNWNIFSIEWEWKHNIPKPIEHSEECSESKFIALSAYITKQNNTKHPKTWRHFIQITWQHTGEL